MKRPLLLATAVVAIVAISTAVAILSPAFRTQSLSPLPGAAAASEGSVRTAEGSKAIDPEPQSGIPAQAASQ
ncbi:MAG TPA: hypothetical protein VLJ17_08810, partial [Xanthobacteraceae bacterium]|nr:hypothetical protein [Xanthobacteraceae bacterium]